MNENFINEKKYQMYKSGRNLFEEKKVITGHPPASVLIVFLLMKNCVELFRLETIVVSFMHLMMFIYKILIHHN